MEEDPSISLSSTVSNLSTWSDADLLRVHRLAVLHLRSLVADPSPDAVAQVEAAEEESLLFGTELLRRGLI